MKATPKPEYVGQTHVKHGYLVAGAVYEVDELGEVFVAVKADKAAKAAKE